MPSEPDKTRQVELLISTLLRTGVIASICVIVLGVILTFLHHPDYVRSKAELSGLVNPSRAEFPHTIKATLLGFRHVQGRSVVVLGLLILLATPILRVAVSIFAFIYERDPIFVVITTIVLALLGVSFYLGHVAA